MTIRIVSRLVVFGIFSVATVILVSAPGRTETATFAGGCFWCMEPPFDKLKGVRSTTSGYIGGHMKNPTYEAVSRGGTGHAEAVQIVFEPKGSATLNFSKCSGVTSILRLLTDSSVTGAHSIVQPSSIMTKPRSNWLKSQRRHCSNLDASGMTL